MLKFIYRGENDMKTTEMFWTELQDYIEKKGIKRIHLARILEVSPSWITECFDKKQAELRRPELEKLAKFMGVPIETFFYDNSNDQEMIEVTEKDLEVNDHKLAKLLKILSTLPDSEKVDLLEMLI